MMTLIATNIDSQFLLTMRSSQGAETLRRNAPTKAKAGSLSRLPVVFTRQDRQGLHRRNYTHLSAFQ